MANKLEVIFQTLRGDLVTLSRAMGTLVKKLPEEDAKIMPKDYTADEARQAVITVHRVQLIPLVYF